jgi:hypothetical protein
MRRRRIIIIIIIKVHLRNHRPPPPIPNSIVVPIKCVVDVYPIIIIHLQPKHMSAMGVGVVDGVEEEKGVIVDEDVVDPTPVPLRDHHNNHQRPILPTLQLQLPLLLLLIRPIQGIRNHPHQPYRTYVTRLGYWINDVINRRRHR